LEHDAAVGHGADAHLGSSEVLEHGDGRIQPFREGANPGDDRPVLGVIAVGEVEPGHVHPGFDERLQGSLGRRGGTNGAHDLRLALHVAA